VRCSEHWSIISHETITFVFETRLTWFLSIIEVVRVTDWNSPLNNYIKWRWEGTWSGSSPCGALLAPPGDKSANFSNKVMLEVMLPIDQQDTSEGSIFSGYDCSHVTVSNQSGRVATVNCSQSAASLQTTVRSLQRSCWYVTANCGYPPGLVAWGHVRTNAARKK